MKRQIICLACAQKNPPKDYPGEWWVRMKGCLLASFVCDICDISLLEGTLAIAESMGTTRMHHYPWEDKFIRILKAL